MRWKGFFYFTRSERQGIIVLIVLIVVVIGGFHFIPQRQTVPTTDTLFNQEYASFEHSLQQQQKQKKLAYPRYTKSPARAIVLQPFDPNTTDSIGFLELGLPSWMAHNILRYRTKGGRFRKSIDFKKMYGLTPKQYATLEPFLAINDSFSQRDTFSIYTRYPQKKDLVAEKYPAGTTVDLNKADTTELKKIPGVGSGIAQMIVTYRKQLGGFYRIEQLTEIRLAADKLRSWLTVDPQDIQPININKKGVESLKRHPYLNFYQARSIVEYRKKNGPLHSLQQLKFDDAFTPTDLERIAPYICFE